MLMNREVNGKASATKRAKINKWLEAEGEQCYGKHNEKCQRVKGKNIDSREFERE